MRVRLTTSRASHAERNAPGDLIDLPADEAQRLIEAGSAEPVIETAACGPPQHAEGRRRRPKPQSRGE